MPPDQSGHDVPGVRDETAPPQPAAEAEPGIARAQARMGGLIARHPVLLRVLDFLRRGPFDNVNP